MWPAAAHDAVLCAARSNPDELCSGDVVVAGVEGAPDLFRVQEHRGERVRVVGEAEVGDPVEIPVDAVLAKVRLPRVALGRRRRRTHRLLLDLREAWSAQVETDTEPADTVRDKYSYQAPFYTRTVQPDLDTRLFDWIRQRVGPGGDLLVIGSGTGRECFALANAGWNVIGVDFSPPMIELARREAERRALPVVFHLADIREYEPERARFSAVLFTYDVYSFLPQQADRIALLHKIRTCLATGGVVFLSARRVRSGYARMILTVQWLARRGRTPWGASHTRWLTADGVVHRSFVQLFTDARLRAEVSSAGFLMEAPQSGHAVLTPAAPQQG
jgi:SAM-dependent methyltransferase